MTAPPAPRRPRPLPGWGAARALRLWKVVLAVWAVPMALFLPAVVVVQAALGPALARLPAAAEVPQGDLVLIVLESMRGTAGTLQLALLGGCLSLWLWTLLWHGGVARWQHWTAGDAPRLSEVLGLGLLSLWRSICLSATAVVGLAVMVAPLWLIVWWWVDRQYQAMNDSSLFTVALTGDVLTALAILLCWAATLRGFWSLTAPISCSPVAAWVRGLGASLRQPLATFGTLLLWLVPAAGLAAVPLLAGWWFEFARGGLVSGLVAALAGVLRAYCWVALFASFAPTTGLWPTPEKSS